MSAITQKIAHAPKWAWYTVAGVAGGTVAIKMWQNRAQDEDTDPTDTPVENTQGDFSSANPYGTSGLGGSPSPIATVTPSVVIAGNDGGGSIDPTPYLTFATNAIGSLGEAYSTVYLPIAQTNNDIANGLLANNAALAGAITTGFAQATDSAVAAIATAGSAPSSVTQMPAAIATPVAAAPAAPAAATYKVEYDKRTRDNGQSGAARKVWCNRVTIHRYPDGRGVVVDEVKIKDGAC